MAFDFNMYISDLRDNPEKKETVEKYEKHFWEITGDIQDQIWFKEYVSNYSIHDYKVPVETQEDFQWDILMKLVAASLSSDWFLEYATEEDTLPEFVISVQSGDQLVVKKVSELWGFQIARLFEIYIEEQMNLQILIAEDENEKSAILAQRESKFNRWSLVINNLQTDREKKVIEKEKEGKLNDLMSQL